MVMKFFRIYNNQLYSSHTVIGSLGFSINDPSYIPDDYLEKKEFVLLRTCFGFGDWGIISAIPRKLKEKYPDCKVYLPSRSLLEKLFGDMKSNWGSWSDPFDNVDYVFDNNPYIDGKVDSVEGEIYHDHFRIYTDPSANDPLAKQMLRFWQFDENELQDVKPELYFSDEEKAEFDTIIENLSGGFEYAVLMASDRATDEDLVKIVEQVKKYDEVANFGGYYSCRLLHWSAKPLAETVLSELPTDESLSIRHFKMRLQLYLRTKAFLNIGNQCGVLDTISQYSHVATVSIQRQRLLRHNFIEGQIYV